MSQASAQPFLTQLPTFDEDSGQLTVIIETPKGSRNKYKYDDKKRLFTLSHVLPAGALFPFDFGFVPSTRGQDGDPLDVLVLMDAPAFVGCLLECRLIGVIEAEQSEDGKMERNDRLIAVASHSREHKDIENLDQVSPNLVNEIEHFFASYNEIQGKKFKVLGRPGPEQARRLVEDGVKLAKAQ